MVDVKVVVFDEQPDYIYELMYIDLWQNIKQMIMKMNLV